MRCEPPTPTAVLDLHTHNPDTSGMVSPREVPGIGWRLVLRLALVACLVYPTHAEAPPQKLIIDADPAMGVPFRDVDDGLMILLAVSSPEVDILGITTTFGNVRQDLAFRSAEEILRAAGRSDINIYPGAKASATPFVPTPASDFISDMAMTHPGEVVVLTTGPVTNVATAIRFNPMVALNVKTVVAMGGSVVESDKSATTRWSDANFGADPQSVDVLFQSDLAITVVSIQLCEPFVIDRDRYQRMIKDAPLARNFIARNTRFWRILQGGGFIPWDSVALACVIHPEWFEMRSVTVAFDVESAYRRNILVLDSLAEGRRVSLPVYKEEESLFWEWFFERI